jgi:hypothetical protein
MVLDKITSPSARGPGQSHLGAGVGQPRDPY